MDQYQVRDFKAIERHIALVATVHSLLRADQHNLDLHQKLHRELRLECEVSGVLNVRPRLIRDA